MRIIFIVLCIALISCQPQSDNIASQDKPIDRSQAITLTLAEANRLATLPYDCIQSEYPYKSGIILSKPSDNALPIEHHPAFYGCFDWHSAVHGHWSLIYLLKEFPNLDNREAIVKKLSQNLTKANIEQEVAYFSLSKQTKSFERTYGWAWVLKLAEELSTWDDPKAKDWLSNLMPLVDYISTQYQAYLPKLVYPIRVGEHSNTAFGMSFAYDYAKTMDDNPLAAAIETAAMRFYSEDEGCPITWEPSGYDFLSPCLQEMDIMRKILDDDAFVQWSSKFLPSLFDNTMQIEPARVSDRSDGKLVHLDGLNFSRAWCLYTMKDCESCQAIADEHLQYSLDKITDGDYAGQHWLASFALYAFKCQG